MDVCCLLRTAATEKLHTVQKMRLSFALIGESCRCPAKITSSSEYMPPAFPAMEWTEYDRHGIYVSTPTAQLELDLWGNARILTTLVQSV